MERIVVLASRFKDQLAYVREIAGLKAAEKDNQIWLRGVDESDKLAARLRNLPADATYRADEDGRLFPEDGRTPVARLPELDWTELKLFAPLAMPVSAMPSKIGTKISLSISRNDVEHPAFVLLVSLIDWKIYAETAPATRLHVLSFAVSAGGEALITGCPLPQLAGRFYWNNQDMLIPAGYGFDVPMASVLVSSQLPVGANFILFETDGSWQKIPKNVFQPATHSAVRLTKLTNVND